MTSTDILVVVGVGNGFGTGASTARIFAKAGYRVALIARRSTASELTASGGQALPITLPSYTPDSFASAFNQIHQTWPDGVVRVAVFNTAFRVWKPFLEVTPSELQESLDTNISAAFAFAREAILAFQSNTEVAESKEDGAGKKGTLIFTGATAAIRGNKHTSAFAASKHGTRALAQSLAKEFGPQGIHVAHVIVDGSIKTDKPPQGKPNVQLEPDSIAKTYLALAKQDKSAFTWELDLRPSEENW